MRLKRKRKSAKYRGSQTAKRGRASRTRASGSQGGVGMAGTGKRGDQKKTLVIKLTGGNNYFGKSKALRRGSTPKKLNSINISEINRMEPNSEKIIDLSGYKILGDGELTSKVKIKASAVSASAKEKIEKSGSELILEDLKVEKEEPKKEKVKKKAVSKKE